jgi:sarcosine oxidase subunit gamma
MADLLFASSPLGLRAAAPASRWQRADALVVRERPIERVLGIRFEASDGAAMQAIEDRFGLRLRVGSSAVRSGNALALCLGPGDWLVLPTAPVDHHAAGATLVDAGWSAVDASDAWFAVRVEGPASRSVLAEASALDTRPDRFGFDATAVTRFARLRALVHRIEGSDAFDVLVERSHARYLWTWLSGSMGPFTATEA